MVETQRVQFLAVCLALIIIPVNFSLAEDQYPSQTNDPPQIILDQQNGIYVFDDYLNISGSVIDEELPNLQWWLRSDSSWGELVVSNDVRHGTIIEISEEHSTDSALRLEWLFSIEINMTDMMPCSCEVVIRAIESSVNTEHYVDESLRIFSLGFPEGETSADPLPPHIIIDELPTAPSSMSGNLLITGEVLTLFQSPIGNLEWDIHLKNQHTDTCHHPSFLGDIQTSENWSNISLNPITNEFSISFDTTTYLDGMYGIFVREVSNSTRYNCLPVGIDNTAPHANISGPSELSEAHREINFDGSGSFDNYWGRESLTFHWVLKESSWDDTDSMMWSGVGISTISPPMKNMKSGNYSLTLTVSDKAGFTDMASHQFNISNIAPIAELRFDGQRLLDGDTVTLNEESFWMIDCLNSEDTWNDRDKLECTWLIDNEPVMTGWERQLMYPDDTSKSHILTLIVTDDDGESDRISIVYGVKGTSSDPEATASEDIEISSLLVKTVVGLFIILLIGLTIHIMRRNKHIESIPKWGDSEKRVDR